MTVLQRIKTHRLLPVIQIDEADQARGLAEALGSGGLPVAEITLRTLAAERAMDIIAREYPDLLLGAGTVSTVAQVDAVVDAGAQFVVTPGFNPAVVARCMSIDMPVIPGVCTPTDVEAALAYGMDVLKFFPAEAAGGRAMIKALGGPYGDVSLIPTGGIDPGNLGDYLALPNVIACGGSWMVARDLIGRGDFATIAKEVSKAVDLVRRIATVEEAA